jgi:EthD domain
VIKLLIVGRGRRDMPVLEQRAYMKDVHGSSVVRLIAEEPDVAPRRYVQNHVIASYPQDASDVVRDFVTQVWFDNPDQMKAALTAPRYLDDLQPDEDSFVDQSTVLALPVEETVLLAHSGGQTAKVVLLLRRAAPDLDLPSVGSAGVRGLVRNRVVRDGAPYTLVYEAWFDDLEVASTAAAAWGVRQDGSEDRALALVAIEHVLHAGSPATVD